MAINEAVNIGINVDGTASVQQASNAYEDLGDAVAKTQLEAEKLAQQFGINDARTQEAIKTAGKYKQQMEQLDFAIDAARGGSDQLFRATQGVVAGFELAAGAMALFGSESEELQKILMKVQGAMALSQGLKDLNEFSPAIKNVASAFSGILTKAVQGFSKAAKAAMAATGIGLLVVAVASLVEYWDDIMQAVNGVSSEQKELVKEQQKSADLASKQLDDISAQENILKQQGKTEEDILKMKIAASKNAITALEAQLTTQQEMKKSQIDAAKRNKEIAELVLKGLLLPITLILTTIDKVRNALGQTSNLADDFFSGAANLVFDPKAVEEEADKTIKTTEDNLKKLKNSVAGYEMQKTQIQKQAADKAFEQWQAQEIANQEYREKLAEEEFEAFLAQEIANQEYREKLAEEEFQAIQAQEIANYEYRLELAKKNAEDRLAIEEQIFDDMKSLVELSNAFLENSSKRLDADYDNRIAKLKELGYNEEQIANMRDAELERINERAKENFEIAKKLQYAQTLLSTIQGTQEAFTTANKSPITPFFPAYPFLQAAAAAAFGVAQLQQISQSSYTSKSKPSGGASSAAATSVPTFQAPSVRLGVQGEQFTQVNRVYVTEADISGTQNRVKVTEGISTI